MLKLKMALYLLIIKEENLKIIEEINLVIKDLIITKTIIKIIIIINIQAIIKIIQI